MPEYRVIVRETIVRTSLRTVKALDEREAWKLSLAGHAATSQVCGTESVINREILHGPTDPCVQPEFNIIEE